MPAARNGEDIPEVGRMTLLGPPWLLERLKASAKRLGRVTGRPITYGEIACAAIYQFVAASDAEQLECFKTAQAGMIEEVQRALSAPARKGGK